LLLRICGVFDEESLLSTKELKISVDTKKYGPCDEIGYLLPKLHMLYFENSALASMRDLGTSMRFLRVLKAPHCGLTELDGVSALFSLEELYVAFNEIWDLSAMSLHDSLQVLDLEGNNIEEILQIAQLGTCTSLWCLTLTGCPIFRRCASQVNYRRVVCMHIPSLQSLDDEPVSDADRESPDTRAVFRNQQRPFSVPSPHKVFNVREFCNNSMLVDDDNIFLEVEEFDPDSELVTETIKMFRPHRDTFDHDTTRPFTTGSLRDNEVFSLLHHSREVSASQSATNGTLPITSADKPMPSSLTHGDSDLFSGNAIRGLRHRYRKPSSSDVENESSHEVSRLKLSDSVDTTPHPMSGGSFLEDNIDELDTESIGLRALRKRASESSPTTHSPIVPKQDTIRKLDGKVSDAAHGRDFSFNGSGGVGAATLLTDVAVVSLLRMRPKDVPQLRTRSGFQRFFNGGYSTYAHSHTPLPSLSARPVFCLS
jgi:hypothetical protein